MLLPRFNRHERGHGLLEMKHASSPGAHRNQGKPHSCLLPRKFSRGAQSAQCFSPLRWPFSVRPPRGQRGVSKKKGSNDGSNRNTSRGWLNRKRSHEIFTENNSSRLIHAHVLKLDFSGLLCAPSASSSSAHRPWSRVYCPPTVGAADDVHLQASRRWQNRLWHLGTTTAILFHGTGKRQLFYRGDRDPRYLSIWGRIDRRRFALFNHRALGLEG